LEQPIFVIGTNTTDGYHGTGYMSLVATLNGFLDWNGVNSNGMLTASGSSNPGDPILAIDGSGNVTLQVGFLVGPTSSRASFHVHNATPDTQTGFVWVLPAPV
jgi:hypothetical protein